MRLRVLSLITLTGLTVAAFAGDPPPPACAVSLSKDVLTVDWSARSTLADRGVVPTLSYVGEVMGNTTGGFRRATSYEGLLTLCLDVDLQKLAGWQGAKFHFAALQIHGAGLSQKAVGDVGLESSIDAYDGVRLDTLWIEQSFCHDYFSLRAGLIAVDDEFYFSAPAQVFLRANFGWPSALGLNVPLPTYPYASPGVRLKIQPTDYSYIMMSAVGGNPAPAVFRDPSPNAVRSTGFNKHGTDWDLRSDEGAFFIVEGCLHFNDPPDPNAPPATSGKDDKKSGKAPRGLGTTLKLGAGYHSDDFSDIYDACLINANTRVAPLRARSRGGDWAVYGLVSQELYREPGTEAQGLSAFLNFNYMPPDRNLFDFSGEAGLVYTGLLHGRPDDICGAGFTIIHASPATAAAARDANRADDAHVPVPDYEIALEATYNIHARPGLWIQPDVQFVVHPGVNGDHGNALIVGLRTTINF